MSHPLPLRHTAAMPKQFEKLAATELYCPRCRVAQPVRERLLLVLPHAELHEYRCSVCGDSLATREVTAPPVVAASAARPPGGTAHATTQTARPR